MVDVLKKEMKHGFDDSINLVKESMLEQGFNVMMVKSIDEIFQKQLGIHNAPRYTIVLGCGPDLAKMALDISKDIGNLFPCSFTVFEDDGKVMVSHLSIMKAAVELGLASAGEMKSLIDETSKRVHKVWDKLG